VKTNNWDFENTTANTGIIRNYSGLYSGFLQTQLNFPPKSMYKSLATTFTILPTTSLFLMSPFQDEKNPFMVEWNRLSDTSDNYLIV
jgi:hypothetical protein